MGGWAVTAGTTYPLCQWVISMAHDTHTPRWAILGLTKYYPTFWSGFIGQASKCRYRECQLQQETGPQGGPLHPMPLVSIPFERIGINIVGPFF